MSGFFPKLFVILLSIVFIGVGTAAAHSVGTSYVRIEQSSDATISNVRVDLSLRDLAFAVGIDANRDGRITWGEVLQQSPSLVSYVTSNLTITRGERHCVLDAPTISIDRHSDGPYAVVILNMKCPTEGLLAVRSNMMFDIDAGHRSLLSVVGPVSQTLTVLTIDSRIWKQSAADSGRWSAFLRFVVQGVWHIWTGFDHLAFLLLLLLPLARPGALSASRSSGNIARAVFRVVTAFTAAHSITLACAAFDYIHLPSKWVESAIAVTIVITGIANFYERTARFGMAVAFGFGLIHGLGFASALADITSNATHRLLPLVGFNLGVEIGQLAVVAALFPILFLNRGSDVWRRHAVTACSLAITALGMAWLIQRVAS